MSKGIYSSDEISRDPFNLDKSNITLKTFDDMPMKIKSALKNKRPKTVETSFRTQNID